MFADGLYRPNRWGWGALGVMALVVFLLCSLFAHSSLAGMLVEIAQSPSFLLFVPFLFVLVWQQAMKDDFLTGWLLRRESRESVWDHQMLRLGTMALFFGSGVTASGFLFGLCYAYTLTDWAFPDGPLCTRYGVTVTTPFWQVLLAFFLFCVLSFWLAGLLFQWIYWRINRAPLGWIALIGMTVWDLFLPDYSVFIGRLILRYEQWLAPAPFAHFLWGAAWLAVLYGSGRLLSCRKEFLPHGS